MLVNVVTSVLRLGKADKRMLSLTKAQKTFTYVKHKRDSFIGTKLDTVQPVEEEEKCGARGMGGGVNNFQSSIKFNINNNYVLNLP